ncbi:hypothetical protein FQN60_018739 [Etheostoma spectabile]|uniref:Uncharacterized protein n=1 Tax=Etheostoma spectabile TaxID=54343 RepID=A0A5J5C9Z3_9PERO|nr:hypothetical protein FQN60_018739 [Etheostoma spectabile]
MYIDDRLPQIISEATDNETGQVLNGMDLLPSIRRRYVHEDYRWFQQELREWEEQFCQAAAPQGESTAAHKPQKKPKEEPRKLTPPPQSPHTLGPSQSSASAEKELQSHISGPEAELFNLAPSDPSVEKDDTQAAGLGPQAKGASEASREALDHEAKLEDDQQQQEGPGQTETTENKVSEVEIPSVGRIMVRADVDGYNEEMMLTPATTGVILAVAKARQTFNKEGPEAGLIKVFHKEYSRLYELSKGDTPGGCSSAARSGLLLPEQGTQSHY